MSEPTDEEKLAAFRRGVDLACFGVQEQADFRRKIEQALAESADAAKARMEAVRVILEGFANEVQAEAMLEERARVLRWLRGPLLLAVGKGFGAMDPGLPMANAKKLLEKLAEEIERGEHMLR